MASASNKTIRVAICDDHRSFIDGLAMVISAREPEMKLVGTANNFESLKPVLKESPDVILLDVDLETESSLSFLKELSGMTDARILMITGGRDRVIHEEAMLKGARGVLLKNESAKVILRAIEKVHEGEIWIEQKMLAGLLDKFNHSKRSEPDSKVRVEVDELTPRERSVIKALVMFEASTNKEIAENLFISISTLKNHLTTIFSKLSVKNRVELIKYALANNLSDPPGESLKTE